MTSDSPTPPFSSGAAPPRDATSVAQPAEPRSVESSELFQGARVVAITHAGETYRLLVTRNNRLILQK